MSIERFAPSRNWLGRAGEKTARDIGSGKVVAGVRPGVIGQQLGVLDCNNLARALPAARDSREGGFRDAIESLALALQRKGVELPLLNAAVGEVLDAYANNS